MGEDFSSGPAGDLPSNAGDVCWIPDWGAKTSHALRQKDLNIKQRPYGRPLAVQWLRGCAPNV